MGLIEYTAEFEEKDKSIEVLAKLRLDLLKITYESMGVDYGETKNDIKYKNYLAENPIKLQGFGGGDGDVDSMFGSAGAGKLPIPPGFYSDKVLYEFITHAECPVGIYWVTTVKGDVQAVNCGVKGWDLPGGVHSKSIAAACGITDPSVFNFTVSRTNGRKAMGGEIREGAAWGWLTNSVPASNPYWQKLIPYYRDCMIWAWHQPIIQEVKNPAERLARMHSINWWGYHYLKGFSGGSGWGHRFQAAQRACSGMGYYS